MLFCKNIDIDAIFLAKCRDLRTFFSVPPKQSKISPSSAFKFLSALIMVLVEMATEEVKGAIDDFIH